MLDWFHGCKAGHTTACNQIVSKPSRLECFPAEYASTKRTKNGASMGTLYTSSEDLLFVVFERVQPEHAVHICLM
jgi:hypothetical protein